VNEKHTSGIANWPGSSRSVRVEKHCSFVAGDDLVQAAWTSCTWDGAALTLSAEGDGNEIEATTSDDGTIEITVTGSAE